MNLTGLDLRQLPSRIFLAFVAICPFFYHASINLGVSTLRTTQNEFYQLGATVLFAIFCLSNIYLAGLLLWAVFLYGYFVFRPEAGAVVLNLLCAGILYEVTYKLASERFIDRFFNVLKWLVFANVSWMILQACNYDLIFVSVSFKQYSKDLVGLFGIKAFNGVFLALMVSVIARGSLLTATLLLIPIALTETSICLFSGVLSVLFWTAKKYGFSIKKLLLILPVVGLCTIPYFVNDSKTGGYADRVNLWKVTLRDAFKHPVLGWGLDSFRSVNDYKPFMYFKNVRTLESAQLRFHKETKSLVPPKGFEQKGDILDPWDNPHNEYVQLFYEFGVFGVLLFGFLVKNLLDRYKAAQPYDRTHQVFAMLVFFAALFTVSIAQFPFHVARIGYLAPIFLALYFRQTEKFIQLANERGR